MTMNNKQKKKITNIVFSASFLALSYVLPFLTGQVPDIGNALLPMHLPVLLCGYICGGPWGMIVGIVAPLLRSLTLGMPQLYPRAIAMAFELGAYGLFTGTMYKLLPKKRIYIYVSLLVSMVIGRIVWGLAQFTLLGFDTEKFGLVYFFTESVIHSIPGIVLQILIVPVIIMLIDYRAGKTIPNSDSETLYPLKKDNHNKIS